MTSQLDFCRYSLSNLVQGFRSFHFVYFFCDCIIPLPCQLFYIDTSHQSHFSSCDSFIHSFNYICRRYFVMDAGSISYYLDKASNPPFGTSLKGTYNLTDCKAEELGSNGTENGHFIKIVNTACTITRLFPFTYISFSDIKTSSLCP